MIITRHILRGIFVVLTIILLVYLNNKTGVNLKTVARFKVETFNKVQADSLDNKAKLRLLIDETTKFSGQIDTDTSHASAVITYLIDIVVLFIASEIIFVIIEKRRSAHRNQN
ncbi:MAG: hypothetical protein ABI477_21770 [Chryseolinea sp.]